MPEKFEFYYRCFCCGYLVSDIEYETAYVFERCPRCHAGVENFVPEAHLTKRALDGACTSCKLELTPQCPVRTGNGCDLFQPRQ